MLFHSNAAYTPRIMVFRPDGSLLGAANSRYEVTLSNTGTFTVAVIGLAAANSGSYRLDYVRGASTVSDGTLITASPRGRILLPNGINSYKFSGVASNSISIATSGAYTRRLTIFRPDGSLLTAVNNSYSGTLPATGMYTVVVGGHPARRHRREIRQQRTPDPHRISGRRRPEPRL